MLRDKAVATYRGFIQFFHSFGCVAGNRLLVKNALLETIFKILGNLSGMKCVQGKMSGNPGEDQKRLHRRFKVQICKGLGTKAVGVLKPGINNGEK